jgi:hypothetical protein
MTWGPGDTCRDTPQRNTMEWAIPAGLIALLELYELASR